MQEDALADYVMLWERLSFKNLTVGYKVHTGDGMIIAVTFLNKISLPRI